MWLGEFDVSSLVDFKFTTRQSTGAPTTLAGSPAISVYKSNSTTESTTGVTLTADFDSRTGLNHVRIDTSADGTFYATGTDFQVVITTGTVNSVSVVGEVVGHFTLRNRAALKPATAGRTLVVDSAGLADANAVKVGPTGSGTAQTARDIGASVLLSSGTGTGQVKLASGYVAPNWGDVGNPTTTNNLSGTSVKTASDVETDTADIQSRIPAALGANGNIKADVRDFGGTAGTFSGGRPEVNTTHWAGAATATDDVALATSPANFAALGINASGHVSRVTLTDTLTTYTDNAPQTGDNFTRLGAPAGASIAADIAGVPAAAKTAVYAGTFTEPAAGTPPSFSSTFAAWFAYWAAVSINEIDQTSTLMTLRNNADNNNITTFTASDDGTTLVVGKAT